MTSPRSRTAASSLRALLNSLIDYAGLFPPAALDMREAVANFSEYAHGTHVWALGQFVLPATRLVEFEEARRALANRDFKWNLSVLLGENLEADFHTLRSYVETVYGDVEVRSVETRISDNLLLLHDIEKLIGQTIENRFYEVPVSAGKETLRMIRDYGAFAKIRTGGLVASAIPEAPQIADFLMRCSAVKVPFKATAGLHHPIRCVKPLTYETDAPTGTMHGFLNLFLAATLAFGDVEIERAENEEQKRELLTAVLTEDRSSSFHFSDSAAKLKVTVEADGRVVHREMTLSTEQIAKAREEFAVSFGSCSFVEPISDLEALTLL